MRTLSVLREDFPIEAAGPELVAAVRRLDLGELMVLLSAPEAGPVVESLTPASLLSAAVDAFTALGPAEVQRRARAVHPPLAEFESAGDWLLTVMYLFGGAEEFFRLMFMARQIHVAAGLVRR